MGEMKKGERRKEKSASKREQCQVYLNVAEREQIQDRKAGLKEKYHAGLLLDDFLVYSYFVYLSTEMRIHSAKASPFRGRLEGAFSSTRTSSTCLLI